MPLIGAAARADEVPPLPGGAERRTFEDSAAGPILDAARRPDGPRALPPVTVRVGDDSAGGPIPPRRRPDVPARAPAPPRLAAPAPAGQRTFEIDEFRVAGVSQLTEAEIEGALEPFLGPGRILQDVESARAALEQAYSDRGYQAVNVAIPPQTVREGVVALQVTEGRVGRLRVRGARWFSPFEVKRLAPSMAEGAVPNYNRIVRDLGVLNQLPDRRVTPTVQAGLLPGTVDVDLTVQDVLPLHGSLELNDRYSDNTARERLLASLRYDNLFQLGQTLSLSVQLTPSSRQEPPVHAPVTPPAPAGRAPGGPRRLETRPVSASFASAVTPYFDFSSLESFPQQVISAAYVARFPGVTWLTASLTGVLQDSSIITEGGIAVKAKGRILGGRATFTLPGSSDLFHALSVGPDLKKFDELVSIDGQGILTPITYVPLTVQYAATWQVEGAVTQLDVSAMTNLRGLGSDLAQFDAKRYRSSAAFAYLRGNLSRSQDVAGGLQLFGKAAWQYSRDPLVGSEQLTAGGAESVRGYLEVQASGDAGLVGTAEVRSPSLASWLGGAPNELRFAAFLDAGWLTVREPLPEETTVFRLWSVGLGTRLKLGHLVGDLDLGLPLATVRTTARHHPRLHFRLAGEF
jgi:hemolysin activation/secretion protein